MKFWYFHKMSREFLYPGQYNKNMGNMVDTLDKTQKTIPSLSIHQQKKQMGR